MLHYQFSGLSPAIWFIYSAVEVRQLQCTAVLLLEVLVAPLVTQGWTLPQSGNRYVNAVGSVLTAFES